VRSETAESLSGETSCPAFASPSVSLRPTTYPVFMRVRHVVAQRTEALDPRLDHIADGEELRR
jgi:hypothetical protein